MMVSIDCISVENTIPRNLYERSAPDYQVCNAPMESIELILSGAIYDYLRKDSDDSLLD